MPARGWTGAARASPIGLRLNQGGTEPTPVQNNCRNVGAHTKRAFWHFPICRHNCSKHEHLTGMLCRFDQTSTFLCVVATLCCLAKRHFLKAVVVRGTAPWFSLAGIAFSFGRPETPPQTFSSEPAPEKGQVSIGTCTYPDSPWLRVLEPAPRIHYQRGGGTQHFSTSGLPDRSFSMRRRAWEMTTRRAPGVMAISGAKVNSFLFLNGCPCF